MASVNSIQLRPVDWIDPAEWADAAQATRERFLRWVADRAQYLKKRELAAGKGADGKPLRPVKPRSRRDGATGKPLDPHYAESRVVRWMRTSVGAKAGTVTIWWSHGWATILGYHRAGIRSNEGPVVRDVIGLTPADTRKLTADARFFWRAIYHGAKPTPKAPPKPRPPVAIPAPPAPKPIPLPVPIPRPVPIPVPAVAKPLPASKPRAADPNLLRAIQRGPVVATLAQLRAAYGAKPAAKPKGAVHVRAKRGGVLARKLGDAPPPG